MQMFQSKPVQIQAGSRFVPPGRAVSAQSSVSVPAASASVPPQPSSVSLSLLHYNNNNSNSFTLNSTRQFVTGAAPAKIPITGNTTNGADPAASQGQPVQTPGVITPFGTDIYSN